MNNFKVTAPQVLLFDYPLSERRYRFSENEGIDFISILKIK